MTTKSFIAQNGQSIYDLAFMAYGDNSAIFQLLGENPSLNLSSNTYAGINIVYTPQINNNYTILQLTNKLPATAWQPQIINDYLLQEDGFDFELETGIGKIELEN